MVTVSWDLQPSARPGYGYTAEDPVRLGFSKNIGKNIRFCYTYIQSLRTADQQPFAIISRADVTDPKNEPEQQKFLGLPRRDSVLKGGILDLYELVSINDADTVRLYFDIYHWDTLRVPVGLEFIPPAR